jgi:glycosyltransferase involved in cell wall biosynthesis
MKQKIMRLAASCILGLSYGLVADLSRISGRRGKKGWRSNGRILVIGTFHNPNWFHAHITPLTMAGVEEVILVCDEPVADLPGLTYACPPIVLSRLLSRALAKLVWGMWCGLKYKPDFYMGYHIFPGAVTALALARIFNRPACYQCTAGQLELVGGGWEAENRILVALGSASPMVEKKVHAVVREFDLVVVRGTGAETYIRRLGYARDLKIITGSVDVPEVRPSYDSREFDLIFVGRLAEYKRPDRLVDVIAELSQQRPDVSALIVGEGPDRQVLEVQASNLGLSQNVRFLGKRSDVNSLLGTAKVFILTSRWEGLSIAMMEAMATGTVPVVADVGDLKDFVKSGENGYVISQDDISGYVSSVESLLASPRLWNQMSMKARETAAGRSSRESIASRWRNAFDTLKSSK